MGDGHGFMTGDNQGCQTRLDGDAPPGVRPPSWRPLVEGLLAVGLVAAGLWGLLALGRALGW